MDRTSNDTGFFECGRNHEAYELKIFNNTIDFVCDDCVLKLEWFLNGVTYSTCSDVKIITEDTQCEQTDLCCQKILESYKECILLKDL